MRPNLLIVLSDQLRRSALSVHSDEGGETPCIDALARAGTRFDGACSTYPVCVPYRFTFMTGRYAHTRMIPAIEWRMSPAERTLADEFNAAGYQTAWIGKWHLYGGTLHVPGYSAKGEGSKPVPREYQGRWEYWRGFELRNGHFDTKYFVDDDPTPRAVEGYQTDGLVDLALRFLEKDRDPKRPFCCVVSVEPPHPPFEAPKDLEEKWMARPPRLPESFGEKDPYPDDHQCRRDRVAPEEVLRRRQTYHAMVENLDRNVGRLLAALDQSGLSKTTVVVLTSDHGELGGSHGLLEKQYPYEESVGVPFLVSGPGIPPGRCIAEPTATEDLFPTFLGLAGIRPPADLPGANLAGALRGEAAMPDRGGVLLEFVSELRKTMPFHRQAWRGFRSRRYKYTVLGDATGARPWQFFDLEADPHEMTNLVDDPSHAAEIARHHAMMRERMVETLDDSPLAPAWGCDGLNLHPPPAPAAKRG